MLAAGARARAFISTPRPSSSSRTTTDKKYVFTLVLSLISVSYRSPSHRMKHMAAYLMLVLGGNENPTADDVSKALSSVGVETDSEQLDKLISELEGKDLGEVLESGEAMLAKFGSGGGGGGGGGGGTL